MSEARNRKPTLRNDVPDGASNKSNNRKTEESREDRITILDILRMVLGVVLLAITLSYYVTGTMTWGIETSWTNPRYVYFKLSGGPKLQLSEDELSRYNGQDPSLPIYLAINGSVFDVTSNPLTYGPGGAYEFFSGRDAARAYITGCFKQDITHDLRGIDEKIAKATLDNWKNFYSKSHKYWYVGEVHHPPLSGEPPAPCEGLPAPGRVHKSE